MNIVKAMGFGFTDLKYNHETLEGTDSRIDWGNLRSILQEPSKFSDGKFADHLLANPGSLWKESGEVAGAVEIMLSDYQADEIKAKQAVSPTCHAAEGVIYDPRNLGPGVLLMVPYSNYDSWVRVNDPFDFVEHDALSRLRTPKVDVLYPLSSPYSLWCNERTGQPLVSRQMMAYSFYQNMKNAGADVSDSIRSMGFLNEEDFKENFRANVPNEIKEFASMSGLFTDPTVMRDLKPMVIRYVA